MTVRFGEVSSEIQAEANEPFPAIRPSDDVLLRRLHEGDADALAVAYQRWGTLVHSLALRSLGNHHDAEDVTQQVFVSAWRSRRTLRPEGGSLAGWLVTVTRRRCADLHETRAREHRRLQAVAHQPVPWETSATEADGVVDQVVVDHELLLMGDPRARILRLSVIEGHSHGDIAEMLDLPLGTVKSHVRRGLLQLRTRLEEVAP